MPSFSLNGLAKSTDQVYIGLDPGRSGGLAILHGESVYLHALSISTHDLWELVEAIPLGSGRFAMLEIVNSRPDQSAVSTFSFGQTYGQQEMALVASSIPYRKVTPKEWQRGVNIGGKTLGEKQTVWKNRLRAHAQKLFPGVKITLATADALLMAEYCRRFRTGQVPTKTDAGRV